MLKLIIGNKAYSSWSLRGWLAVRQSGLAFEEITVPLFDAEWDRRREGDEFAPVVVLAAPRGGFDSAHMGDGVDGLLEHGLQGLTGAFS